MSERRCWSRTCCRRSSRWPYRRRSSCTNSAANTAPMPAELLALLGRLMQQVGHADGDDRAAQGLARAEPLQQVEKTGPRRGIDALFAVLRGVAARGIEQHRLLGEP